MSLSLLQTILLLNTAICLIALYGAVYWLPEALGGVLLLQSACEYFQYHGSRLVTHSVETSVTFVLRKWAIGSLNVQKL